MKTIADLNSKWWYRLAKVVYILFGFAVILAITALNFSAVGTYQNDFKVTCNFGNGSSFLAYKDKGLYIPLDDYSESLAHLPQYSNQSLRTICEIDEEELIANFNKGEGKKLFELTNTKVPVATYTTATAWSIFHILIVLLLLELIRRSFYYVVLGKFTPTKNA